MTQKEFQQIAHTIPGEPGIYKYFDGTKTLLYVGKVMDCLGGRNWKQRSKERRCRHADASCSITT